MEFKHFSHNHGLVSHHVPQGSEIQCSGCKSPGSGNIYACWQCTYFLHDQCFRASRSLNHPSHPLHPLTLVPFPTYPSGSFFCNTCNHGGDGFSYSCSACEFDIHLHCALMPNPNPHVSPSLLPAPNFNSQPQNPLYPPIQTSAFPAYPPPQNYPPQPQPQPTNYPPVPNSPFPNVNPAFPPNPHQPPPAYPQPNPPPNNISPPTHIPPSSTTPPPLPPQPNPTLPTYSTVVNTTTLNPPTPQPSPSKPPSMIKHFSHPHFLKAIEHDQKNKKVCSACEFELSGSAYCCTEPYCTFNLHKSCFDSPREVHHKSHLQHPLTLLTAPPYNDGFTCNACLKDGKAFAYTCSECSYDLHIDCIQWPDKVIRPDHKHSLTLFYSSPAADQASEDATFVCDACTNPVHEMAWLYYCRECDFGTHLECITSGIKQQDLGAAGKTQEELMKELELNFAVLQILAQGRKNALELI